MLPAPNENYYGMLPEVTGNYPIKVEESFFYLYLPIKLAHLEDIRLPRRLEIFEPLLDAILETLPVDELNGKYLYLTAKNQFVTSIFWGNRPGWHTDGFLTDDLNWIWCDRNPTIFNVSNFRITLDHVASLDEFERQAKERFNVAYQPFDLLKLNPFVVHKVAPVEKAGMRCFVKFSLSQHRYNLVGNSHNYLFDYKWKMFDRAEVRNDPSFDEIKNYDFVPADRRNENVTK